MKSFLLSLLILCISASAFTQLLPTTYSRVKIDLRETPITKISQLGMEVDHGDFAKGKYLASDFSNWEIALLEEHNIPFIILIEDVQAHYRHQNEHNHSHEQVVQRSFNNCSEVAGVQFDYETPSNYEFGSMGGYLTYDELLTTLDNMASLFPNLITVRQPIGTGLTEEGRPIFWLRISDNPNVEETEEPEVLYTALHHAREPNSLSQMIFYMWYLLENYDSDPEVRYLVDNTAMHFIPCINPDGYVYNETIEPNGGGLWRKNRAIENGETVGVDLNRNYGFEWGFDNIGSSGNQNSAIYRGPAPFSEPETSAVRDFCLDHQFRICMNYHTFGNVLIYPFGFNDEQTPDQPSYAAFTRAMASENNFPAGTGLETVGATANGDADDWKYGDTIAKPRILSLTPEVGPGTFGFWPPQSAIDELNKSVLLQNLVTAHLLLNYGEAEEINPVNFLTQTEATFTFALKKYGLETGDLTMTINPIGNNISLTNNTLSANMVHLEEASLVANYSLSEDIQNNEEILIEVQIDNGEFITRDTVSKTILLGDFETVASDDGTNAQDWTFTGNWAITNQDFVSPPSSYTDSPNGNYGRNLNDPVTWQIPIDLSDAEQAFLNFYARWDIEAGFDYVQVMASTDGGANYSPLCGNFTKLGTPEQDEGEPLYDGVQVDWVLEEIDLSDYLGETIMIRFLIVSDGFVEGDGFYFDDISVNVINNNTVSTSNTNLVSTFETFPNPFDDELQVEFNLKQASQDISLRLVNSLGQIVSEVDSQDYSSGTHKININETKLSEGVYFLQLLNRGEILGIERVLKVK